jgi:hypothetical protein
MGTELEGGLKDPGLRFVFFFFFFSLSISVSLFGADI